MPARDPRYFEIRARYYKDAMQIMEAMVLWRESPRGSYEARTGMSALTTLWAKVKQDWERDGIPMPAVRESTVRRINTVVLQRAHPHLERRT